MFPTYLLSVLHFNLQYCAGGIDGLVVNWPTDEVSIEDQIIEESFVPVLDLLDRHPTWTFTIELQAYMVQVLAERHPDTLDQLRRLANDGRVELVSFHYSDQLWIAYPPRDMEASLDRVADVFATYDLPLAPVVFTQEGQFATGAIEAGGARGYRIFVLPHNLAEYWWGGEPDQLVFREGDAFVLSGGTGVTTDRYAASWHFLNDGELYATDGMNCYLGAAFVYDEEATAERERDLEAAEAGGARVVGLETFLAEIDVTDAPPLPPTPDGTWQPDDTENTLLWMGEGGLWGTSERDNAVRTTVMAARHAVVAAESVPGADAAALRQAWNQVLLAEVSDATGWNPYPTEVQYAFDHAEAAVAAATAAVSPACGDATALLVQAGEVTLDGDLPVEEGTAADAPFEAGTPSRAATLTWTRVADDELRLEVAFAAGEGDPKLVLPWDGLVFATIPAMRDEVVSIPTVDLHRDPFGAALPLGVLRLAEGRWLVLRTDTVHLAAVLSVADGTVTFKDETDPGEASTWELRVVDGDEARVRDVAWALNAEPPVRFVCPEPADAQADPVVVESPGCGCASGAASSSAAALGIGLAAAFGARRRVRARS